MKTMKSLRMICAALAVMAAVATAAPRACRAIVVDLKGETSAAQPEQPASGPGGSDYLHADIRMSQHGEGNDMFWIFEPADPAPESAPVIVFFHGWSALHPKMYGGWINHLVRGGSIVIFPKYQENVNVMPPVMHKAAMDAVTAALAELEKPGHVKPNLERFAAVGHSFGGVLASNLTANWSKLGLPRVRAAMPVEPGDPKYAHIAKLVHHKPLETIMADYADIHPETLFAVVVGAEDGIVAERTAAEIYRAATSLPSEHKNYIVFHSDRHGDPALAADHMLPIATDQSLDIPERRLSSGPVAGIIRDRLERMARSGEQEPEERDIYAANAHDFALWRLFDSLTDCAFHGNHCDGALGDSDKVKRVGEWSDGVEINKLEIREPIIE
jgi:acetyl esterase/lipase